MVYEDKLITKPYTFKIQIKHNIKNSMNHRHIYSSHLHTKL